LDQGRFGASGHYANSQFFPFPSLDACVIIGFVVFPRLLPALLLSIPWAQLSAQNGPRVNVPAGVPRNPYEDRKKVYPWRKNITATVFWIGEKPGGANPTSNHHSSWDGRWQKNFGGYDNPDPAARANYAPKRFRPGLNSFYVALPYNDCVDHRRHRPEASRVVPWFARYSPQPGKTSCRGRWLQIFHKGKVCYAQWEDCGPFLTDDWKYVFGNHPPRNAKNDKAGIDVSPAVRDFLGLKSGEKVHWRFVEFGNIPRGPWAWYGQNNPFVNPEANPDLQAARRYYEYLKKRRDEAYQRKRLGS